MPASAEVISLTKRCAYCGEIKSIDEFHRRASRGGHVSYCKPCDHKIRVERHRQDPEAVAHARELRRARQKRYSNSVAYFRAYLRRSFGITLEDARHMLRQQAGLCANRACGKELSFDVHGRQPNRAVVDHCHSTGRVRGILCHRCNTTAGLLEKNRNLLLGLSEYWARN